MAIHQKNEDLLDRDIGNVDWHTSNDDDDVDNNSLRCSNTLLTTLFVLLAFIIFKLNIHTLFANLFAVHW